MPNGKTKNCKIKSNIPNYKTSIKDYKDNSGGYAKTIKQFYTALQIVEQNTNTNTNKDNDIAFLMSIRNYLSHHNHDCCEIKKNYQKIILPILNKDGVESDTEIKDKDKNKNTYIKNIEKYFQVGSLNNEVKKYFHILININKNIDKNNIIIDINNIDIIFITMILAKYISPLWISSILGELKFEETHEEHQEIKRNFEIFLMSIAKSNGNYKEVDLSFFSKTVFDCDYENSFAVKNWNSNFIKTAWKLLCDYDEKSSKISSFMGVKIDGNPSTHHVKKGIDAVRFYDKNADIWEVSRSCLQQILYYKHTENNFKYTLTCKSVKTRISANSLIDKYSKIISYCSMWTNKKKWVEKKEKDSSQYVNMHAAVKSLTRYIMRLNRDFFADLNNIETYTSVYSDIISSLSKIAKKHLNFRLYDEIIK